MSLAPLLTWSELDEPRRDRCPRCSARVPGWRWVREDGLRILTHDGNIICPNSPAFGYAEPTPAPAPLPVPEPPAVAA